MKSSIRAPLKSESAPEEREPLYSNVKVERVKVVLIGEELGNFRLKLEV